MKTMARIVALAASIGLLTSCSELVKKTIQDNPEIVFEAIKKDPAGFMNVVRDAAQEAQKAEIQAAREAEAKEREEEFKNPKKPNITPARAVAGPTAAPITIVEYSDFQCPFCQRGAATVEQLMKEYPGKVKLVFKHLPLESKHPNARRGSEYFEALALQGHDKAYAFKKMVFQNQEETYGDAETLYTKLAQKVGANMDKLKADLKGKSGDITKIINGDMEEANKFGFQGTPGYLVNGVSLRGAMPISEFKAIIDRHLGKK